MALSLPDLTLIDPFDGVGDLAARRLRTPLAPEESFTDDPLRMLRAARFIAGYGLVPDPALTGAVMTLRARLDIVSDERIRDELDKLMVVDKPGEGLWFLVRTGLAEEFLPELPALALEQDPIHRHKDVLAHTIAVVENTRPVPAAAPGGAVPRRRQAEDPVVRAAGHGHVPPPRGGRRPDDPRPDEGAPLFAATTSRPSVGSSTSICVFTPTAWAGPTAPSAATCATPGRCSSCSTS